MGYFRNGANGGQVQGTQYLKCGISTVNSDKNNLKTNIFFKTLIVLTAGLTILACEKEKDKKGPVPVLNIMDAESLVILKSSSQSSSSLKSPSDSNDGEVTFYKITVDGSFEEVKFVNADGSDLGDDQAETYIRVDVIYDLNDDYLLLRGDFSVWDTIGNNQDYTSLLVRKSDGAIFNFGNYIINSSNDPLCPAFQTDGQGNAYFLLGNGFYKLDITNPNKLVISEYSPPGQYIFFIGGLADNGGLIDNNGNLIYCPESGNTRIKKADGGIIFPEKNGEQVSFLTYWKGNNGKIYGVLSEDQEYSINKIEISENAQVTELIRNNMIGLLDGFHRIFSAVRKSNSIVFIYGSATCIEFFENTNRLDKHEISELESVEMEKIVHSDTYFYFTCSTSMGSLLYKVSLTDFSYEKILDGVDYEIYSISVSASDVIQFSGLRFSDGKKVFCEIDANGNLTTIDEEQNREGTVLFRLN